MALGPGVLHVRRAEHVRMAADHLVGDPRGHLVEVEHPGFFGHLRVIDHLEQEIAQLVLEVVEITARDLVGNLVGLLDGVGRDGEKSCSRSQGQPASGSRRHAITQSSRSIGGRSCGITAAVAPGGGAAARAGFARAPRATRVGTRPSWNWISSAVSFRARAADGIRWPSSPRTRAKPARARPRSSGWRAGRMRPQAAALPP